GVEVRKEGGRGEARDGPAAADTAGGEEAVAPARVDHETGAQAPRVPPLTDVHRGSGRVELDLLDEGGLEQGDPGLSGGVLEEDPFALRPRPLVAVGRPRLSPARVEAVPEIRLLLGERRTVRD